MYPLPLVRRAKQCWCSLRSWLAENFPEANSTLNKGASEAEIKFAEEELGFKFPLPTKVLYRFCNGQRTMTGNSSEKRRLASLGIIGGYEFYDHIVNMHLLPLERIVSITKLLTKELDFLARRRLILVGASLYFQKFVLLDCDSGQLFVGTKKLMFNGDMMPCVPKSLVRLADDTPQDGLLLWLEEHCRRLQSGMIRTRVSRKLRSISLYPEAPPSCSLAVTNGVQVWAILYSIKYFFYVCHVREENLQCEQLCHSLYLRELISLLGHKYTSWSHMPKENLNLFHLIQST